MSDHRLNSALHAQSVPSFPDTVTDQTNASPQANGGSASSSASMVQPTNSQIPNGSGLISSLKLQDLPPDILSKLFLILAHDPNFSRALTNLSQTSKEFHQLVIRLVTDYKLKSELRFAKSSVTQRWKEQANFIKDNLQGIKDDFEKCRKIFADTAVTNSSSSSHHASLDASNFDGMTGVEIKFQGPHFNAGVMADLISKFDGKVIKLDAKGIGRERFLNEVIPLLKSVPPSCQIALDASDNQLSAEDLSALVDYMSVNPRIHRLDLSRNSLCTGNQVSNQVLQLFDCTGPLTHLYLSGCGFNDATAAKLKDVISKANQLSHLDLRFNRLSTNGVIEVIKAIIPSREDDREVLTSIRAVRLFDNAYSSEDCDSGTPLLHSVREIIKDFEDATVVDPELGKLVEDRLGIPTRQLDFYNVFEIGEYSKEGTINNLGFTLDFNAEMDML